jgi:hypothetical protein
MALSEVLATRTAVAGTPVQVRTRAGDARRNGAQARKPGVDSAAYQCTIQVLEELLAADQVSLAGAEATSITTKAST